MRLNRGTLPLIAFVLGTSGVVVAQGHGPYQPVNASLAASSAAAYAQDYDHHDDWDTPSA